MSFDDCVFLGSQSINNFEQNIGMEWLKEATNRHSSDNLQNKIQIYERLRNISYEHGLRFFFFFKIKMQMFNDLKCFI